ncbi:MAG TPA: hypothetical protein VK203_00915 [Nostocaceae cyanobacterium]|nr:hypothetical protein [Nostocaceae cyanobacterium]
MNIFAGHTVEKAEEMRDENDEGDKEEVIFTSPASNHQPSS